MLNFDPVSTVNASMSIPRLNPLESVHRDPSLASDSIESLGVDSHPVWVPEKPVLTSPHRLPSSEYRLLAATEESRHLGDQILDALGTRLQNIKHKIREISTEIIEKLKEAARRAADSSFWSILKKIATCLISAVSIVFGIPLLASGGGAWIGGTMIVSGIVSLSNFAMSETGAWDWVCKQLANDNEENQKMLAWILPSAFGVVAAGIGIVGSVQSVASGALQFAEKAVSLAQSAMAIFDGLTTFGKGKADAESIWAQSNLIKSQANMTVEQTNVDSVMKEIEGSMNDFKAVKAKTKKIIQTLSQSNVQLAR